MKVIKMGCTNKPGSNCSVKEYVMPSGIVKDIKKVEIKNIKLKKAA